MNPFLKLLILTIFAWGENEFGAMCFKIDCLSPTEADSADITCGIEISNSTSEQKYKISCPQRDMLQIIGEYSELFIRCSAPFPLDFDYDGFQPTEAIRLDFSKRIHSNSSRQLISYNLEVKIQSNEHLYNTHRKRAPDIAKHVYSRTGKYVIRGVFNRTLHRSMYFFLEEENVEKSLMRNKNTVNHTLLPGNLILIPCRPSHMNATVELFLASLIRWGSFLNASSLEGFLLQDSGNGRIYSPTLGWTVHRDEFPSGDLEFECRIQQEGSSNGKKTPDNVAKIFKSIRFKYPQGPIVPFGLEQLPKSTGGDLINMDSEVHVSADGDFTVNLACTVPDPKTGSLSAIEAVNPSHSRLLQEFVFPEYANGSYSVKAGRPSSPPGLFSLPGATLSGLVFCTSGTEYKIQEYATGFDRLVRRFAFGTDWSAFDISQSPPVNHLQIVPVDQKAGSWTFYAHRTYLFRCRVRTHGLVAPVVWYSIFSDNDYSETHIDYHLKNGFAHVELKISENLTGLVCAASFWDRDLWKNVSIKITPINGIAPTILNAQATNTIKFAEDSKFQAMKCDASGTPLPQVKWLNASGAPLGISLLGSATLDFPVFRKENAGNYTCFASNLHGNASAFYSVEITDDGPNYGIVVGVPLAVFIITVAGAYIYFRFIRKEKVGLSSEEIKEFENGCAEPQAAAENNYIPQNALLVPYNKAYEVDTSQFQIARSEVLGSGAFGIVFRGILNGNPVAVKTVKPNAEKAYIKALLSEIKIMIYLGNHPNLVEMVGAHTRELKKGNLFVFVEMCPLGNMEKYLRNNRQNFVVDSGYSNVPSSTTSTKFGLQDLYVWSLQISKGMEYLESKKVIHGDLATRNVLLMSDKTAKITDFGLSRQLYNYASYVKKNEEPLPWRWMALESLRDLTFSCKSDVWSYGITLWEIYSLAEVPYPGLVWDLEFVEKLGAGLRMRQPKYATAELYENVILNTWHADPECRPNFAKISSSFEKFSKHPLSPQHVNAPEKQQVQYINTTAL